MTDWRAVQAMLASGASMLVRVERTAGSAPREVGAWMLVSERGVLGTVGGGQLEFDAMARARAALQAGADAAAFEQRYPLGARLGQCCGGVVWLRFERLAVGLDAAGWRARIAPAAPLPPVALFGGGHVGRAIIWQLARLPLAVQWIDSRDEVFPADLPENVVTEHSDPVQAAVATLTPTSSVLIMSFSHAEDLEIVAAALRRRRERGDLPFIGLIGSKSKWAAFRHRLEARGFSADELAGVTCPIGLPGIVGKQPEVIALAVAAQLLHLSNSRIN